jgi:vacuolar-type H+-ATPase subunit I/STV1
METKFGQSKSSGDYTISEQPERHLAAKHRIHAQLTSKEALKAQTTIAKEEKWRKLRSAQFGPRHKRTNSLPSLRDTGKLYALMELSEQYGRMISKCDSSDKLQQEASSVQKEFKKEVSNIGHLVSMVETTDFEHYVKSLAAQQRALDERMKTITETIAQCEDIIEKVSALSKQIEAFAKQPEAHTQESSSSRSSSDKRRSKTSSFLSFGNKLP